jgi:D-erythronate 2-dehydrogenase
MHVMITGAAGMLGRKLADRLAQESGILGADIERLTLVDIVETGAHPSLRAAATSGVCDISVAGVVSALIESRPDVVFHLAAVVSGEAEADFEKGYRINLDGTRNLFEAIRSEGQKSPYRPRVIFASSIAVFGAPFPTIIPEDFFETPLTSYGTQKAMCELLLSDYSRKGLFDGIGLRLPTICIRPGAPNRAASGFFSNILREPIAGREAVLPVDEATRHWFASPQSAVGFFLHASRLDLTDLGQRRNLTMPGLSATVADEIEALRRACGDGAVNLIRREPDKAIQHIVSGWPSNFDAARATGLGFQSDSGFDDIIRHHLEDEFSCT